MSVPIGRLLFIAFIWIYALVYYLEVRGLDDPSEWMTVVSIFWLFTFFVVLELVSLLRKLRADKGFQNPFTRRLLAAVVRDGKTHLVILIAIYLALIPWLGFYSASFLAYGAFSVALGSRKVGWVLCGAVVVPAIVYVIFSYFLKLELPSGVLF
ncbi:MAG: tripartite tricarboxylate transporter TctB family protein [Deltaproteobacteria bacterium]|nr:tripartite tricarboxylate transporter TctB family protein [Deltaproteobacteria bacterium]